jgi:flagellar protein FliS
MQAGYQTYQRIQTETASPGQLIAMLYDAMLRNLSRAERGIEDRDIELTHETLLRSQDIVLELIASLDTEAGGDVGAIARQLAPLYEYMYRRLIDASIHKDVEAVREVQRLIVPVRDAWSEALVQCARDAATGVRQGGDSIRG